jgi:hypothetical protein
VGTRHARAFDASAAPLGSARASDRSDRRDERDTMQRSARRCVAAWLAQKAHGACASVTLC